MDHKSDIIGDKDTFMDQKGVTDKVFKQELKEVVDLFYAKCKKSRVKNQRTMVAEVLLNELGKSLRKVKQNDARTSKLGVDGWAGE